MNTAAQMRAQVEQLKQEGTKLSEQQMKSATINKKLQAKAKEADAAAVLLNKRIAEQDHTLQQCAPPPLRRSPWLQADHDGGRGGGTPADGAGQQHGGARAGRHAGARAPRGPQRRHAAADRQ